jgi:hypothetical protein
VVTPGEFTAYYPEFADAPSVLVSEAIRQAYALTPASVWPAALQDAGVMLRAAQSLAQSPFGRNMSLADDDGKTAYDMRLERLISIVAAGGAVI